MWILYTIMHDHTTLDHMDSTLPQSPSYKKPQNHTQEGKDKVSIFIHFSMEAVLLQTSLLIQKSESPKAETDGFIQCLIRHQGLKMHLPALS